MRSKGKVVSVIGLVLPLFLVLAAGFTANSATLYVSLNSSDPTPPYADWSTAATKIQDAINAATPGDTILVTNGLYATGGKIKSGDLTNRVALDKAITVQSVNGPWVTTIRGAGAVSGAAAVRCAWVTNSAALIGFTLEGGATRTAGDQTNLQSGGGIWCASTNALISNCVIRSNTASWFGSAVFRGTLNGCLVSGNAANPTNYGIVTDANLNNSTVVSNIGTGVEKITAFQIKVTNCIVYFNQPANHYGGGYYSHCCTTTYPVQPPGSKNIFNTNPELLPDGIHLANGSPCRAAGTNVTGGADIFGKAWADPPSIGCAQWQPEPVIGAHPAVQLTSNPIGFRIGAAVSGAEPRTCFWTRDGVLIENDGHYNSADTPNLAATGIRIIRCGQLSTDHQQCVRCSDERTGQSRDSFRKCGRIQPSAALYELGHCGDEDSGCHQRGGGGGNCVGNQWYLCQRW